MKDNSLEIKLGKKFIHSTGQISIDFKNKCLVIRDTTSIGQGDYIRYQISEPELEKLISDFINTPHIPDTNLRG